MIEQAFSFRNDTSKSPSNHSISGSSITKPSKKQRIGSLETLAKKKLIPPGIHGDGDDAPVPEFDSELEDYTFDVDGSGNGKGSVKGTGYAGSGREDVSA